MDKTAEEKKKREYFLVLTWILDTTANDNIPELPYALSQKEGKQRY